MKGCRWSPVVISLMVISILLPAILFTVKGDRSLPSRAVDEDLDIDITVDFENALDLGVDIAISVNQLIVNGTLLDAEGIRSLYSIDPEGTSDMVEDELWERAVNLTESSFQGDAFEVTGGDFDTASLENESTSPEDPVIYNMTLEGSTDLSRFLDPGRASLLEEGREKYFIASLFMSGFGYSRTVSLIAFEGETVTYRIPEVMDPIGDGDIQLEIGSSGEAPIEGYYVRTVGGSGSYEETYFTFTITDTAADIPTDETIDGDFLLDWKELDTISMEGNVSIHSVSTSRSSLLTSSPASMNIPGHVFSSLIRYSHLEGIMNDDDLSEIEEQMVDEVENTIQEALNDESVEVLVEMDTGTGSLSKPASGSELLSILNSDEPVSAEIATASDTILDILEGYDKDDVKGLLNGGLRIYHDQEPINDDRFDLKIRMPEDLYIWGDPHISESGSRKVYEYRHGRIKVASERAPNITGEELSISGKIDLSGVSSLYFLDLEIEIEADLSFGFGAMTFEQEDFELTTNLDYELDYITSDLIRLLMKMEIVDREEIEETVEDEVRKGLEDGLPEEDTDIVVDLVDSTLIFDGDFENVDSSEHILLDISFSGKFDPFEDNGESNDNSSNAIIPFHLDPILPFVSRTETMELEEGETWDMDLEIKLPSGLGIKAWIGQGHNDKVRELEVDSSGGHPTLHLDIERGEADRITIEVKLGGWLIVNNIGACFGCCMLSVLLVVIIFFLLVLKIARKKKKNKEDAEDGSEKKKGKKKKKAAESETAEDDDPGEDEMSWDT